MAVKVFNDGEEKAVKSSELSVDGVEAYDQISGYNVVRLQSNGTEGIKSFDVEAAKLPVIDTTLTESHRFKSTTNVVLHKKLFPGNDSLSVFGIDREIELSCTDLTV